MESLANEPAAVEPGTGNGNHNTSSQLRKASRAALSTAEPFRTLEALFIQYFCCVRILVRHRTLNAFRFIRSIIRALPIPSHTRLRKLT